MRRSPLLPLLVLAPLFALLAACGASGGDQASTDGGTTTAASGDGGTTSTSTEAEDQGSSDAPSVAALVDLLPTAEEIGDGYAVSDEDLTDDPEETDEEDGDDATDEAILEACPGAEVLEELDNSGGDNPDEVSREFSTDSDQSIEVALDPTGDDFTEDNVDKVVDALADCGTIKTKDEDGNEIEMTLEAERDDTYGDYGLKMSMDATFQFMGTPLSITFRGQIFSVDGVNVSLVATSGLDDATFQVVPGDYDKVPELASEMQDRVAAL
jgi:hypothetical protein